MGAGSWSSGYDISLTRRRSPVRIRSSPFWPSQFVCLELESHRGSGKAHAWGLVSRTATHASLPPSLRVLEDEDECPLHERSGRGDSVRGEEVTRRDCH